MKTAEGSIEWISLKSICVDLFIITRSTMGLTPLLIKTLVYLECRVAKKAIRCTVHVSTRRSSQPPRKPEQNIRRSLFNISEISPTPDIQHIHDANTSIIQHSLASPCQIRRPGSLFCH